MPERTFRYTGRWQRWNVPKGVKYITVTLDGAGSGPRKGGRVQGRMRVSHKKDLLILVGEAGNAPRDRNGGRPTFGGGAAGGDGRAAGACGGWSGGGASAIRVGSVTGQVRAVAGGAGGDSGDRGDGGKGGGTVGGNGWPGIAATMTPTIGGGDISGVGGGQIDTEAVGNATGGTQLQGGNGGRSQFGPEYNGYNATNTVLARGGRGGTSGRIDTWGGGGGGGGYHPGGGGQVGVKFSDGSGSPGGGGGGGSNYVGGLISYTNLQGEGGAGDGRVTISWVNPRAENTPPHPPTDVKFGKKNATDGFATRSTGRVTISAKLSDPDKRYDEDDKPIGPEDRVRLVAVYSPTSDFTKAVRRESGELVIQERQKVRDDPDTERNERRSAETGRGTVQLRGLRQNTRYYVRLYARDERGMLSTNYKSINFWTNRDPVEPTLKAPSDNQQISELSSVVFEWAHNDPDGGGQRRFEIRWRRARTPTQQSGQWHHYTAATGSTTYVADPGTFVSNATTEWTVRTQDHQGRWGPWASVRSIFITGQAAPPFLLYPTRDEAVDVSGSVLFRWRFRDPDQADDQTKADLRWRRIRRSDSEPTPQWVTKLGTTITPGRAEQWSMPRDTFNPGYQYEWQVRTTDSLTQAVSQWSESSTFWTVWTPGVGEAEPLIVPDDSSVAVPSLGCGRSRVFVYDRTGKIPRGEIKPLLNVSYGRLRDDISNCIVDTNGFDEDCGDLLRNLRCWIHQIVIFRDGVRVWEGPITRLEYNSNFVEIEAKDVMAWVYRRIMRQGYNDAWRIVNGEQLGQSTVVERAVQITMNALAPDDPNILPYLTSLDYPDDARTSRAVSDYGSTAWEVIDDMAANAGLDYVTVGRRIIYNDTHRPVGRLPELRDENFSDPPVVSEYGMQLASVFAVTNNNGVYGYKERRDRNGGFKPYGLIEQLASAYGETEGTGATVMTRQARAKLEDTLREQAERNIAGRYPTPLIVRVPDNSTLHPETPVHFNQLIPGVWIPLRARSTLRNVTQWQKLDAVNVEENDSGERVTVVLSPAPGSGLDPDAGEAVEEA